ncbi:MAG: hypothetical protein J0G96_09790 [Flavobacteriia bacterium]|nr:hypothetical protein [Flavobacteriia bacterium]
MKRSFFSALTCIVAVSMLIANANAQENFLQAEIFSGQSKPMKDYQKIGEAQPGWLIGGAFNYYFLDGFGLGLDLRSVKHSRSQQSSDTIFYNDGYISNAYENENEFRHFGISLGPVYQLQAGKISLELFAKGGVLFQKMPQYTRKLHVKYHSLDPEAPIEANYNVLKTTHDAETKAWAVVAGANLSYNVTKNFGLFFQTDYHTTLGKESFGKPTNFTFEDQRLGLNRPLDGVADGTAKVQMLNFNLGIKFSFGKRNYRDYSELKEVQ